MKLSLESPENAIQTELGARMARLRKARGLTQVELADEAGIGIATLRRIEGGQDSQMETWIKLLKPLGQIHALDQLLPETIRSPMAEVKGNRSRRHPKDGDTLLWGDEQP